MSQPLPEKVGVALQTMRREADIWTGAAGQLDAVSQQASSLRIDAFIVWDIWAEFLAVYNDVVGIVATRTHEGSTATSAIGDALHQIATTYEEQERGNLHALHELR